MVKERRVRGRAGGEEEGIEREKEKSTALGRRGVVLRGDDWGRC